MLRLPPRGESYAVRIRLALEELGLTYLKLGQFLALRFDILPEEVSRELNRLFEEVSPIPFEDMQTVLESELHGPLQTFFRVFEPEPIAAASVSQVYEAWTYTNERVAVKIQRPGIEHILAADFRILRPLLKLVGTFGLLLGYSGKEVADEFASWTQRELDFTLEGQAADRLRTNALSYEIIPTIYWNLTTPKVLTMEFIDGLSLAVVSDLLEAGKDDVLYAYLPHLDAEETGHNIAFAIMHQLFVTGFFHADPHPGNIIIRDDNKAAFVDFGICGALTDEEREILAGHIENIALGNIAESFRYFAMQYTPTDDTDLQAFEQEGKAILQRWYQATVNPYATVHDLHLGKYATEMFEVVRRYHLRASLNTLLFWRALHALDAAALRLSDHFDLMRHMRDFFEHIRPKLVDRALTMLTDRRLIVELVELVRAIPDRSVSIFSDVLQSDDEGPLHSIHINGYPESRQAHDTETKWLAIGIVGIGWIILMCWLAL
jgi:ubiquinone biosynthesis protein